MSEQQYGLYYRYNGKLADTNEKERLIHGPASEEECERVRTARIGGHTIQLAEAYRVSQYKKPKVLPLNPLKHQ